MLAEDRGRSRDRLRPLLSVVCLFLLLLLLSSCHKTIADETFLAEGEAFGFVPVDGENFGALYYAFLPRETDSKDAPLILWLNGGPGCSSLAGLFLENGPKLFDPVSKELKNNMHSWHKIANMLYVDNPVGTGFSVVEDEEKSPRTATDVAKHLITALQLLFSDELSEYKNNELWVFGESYGAKYAISLAHSIMKRGNTKLNLQGIALGNGWVNPILQERVYGQLGYALGMYNYGETVRFNNMLLTCQRMAMRKQYYDADVKACTPAWVRILHTGGGFNPYDSRMLGDYSMLNDLETFLNDDKVREKMGTNIDGSGAFEICNDAVFDNFLVEFQKSYAQPLSEVLDKYKVLVFNGQFDLRSSVLGTEEWLRVLDWSGRHGFNYKDHDIFYDSNNVTRGIFKSHLNLEHVVIYNAGHLAPHDAPEASLEMARRFVTHGGLCSINNMANGRQCQRSQCPNECSKHGTCQTETGKCNCDEGYASEDCSLFRGSAVLGKAIRHKGSIFGQGVHEYRLSIAETDARDLLDIAVHFKQMGPMYGGEAVHVFLGVGSKFIKPNEEYDGQMLLDFPLHNTEDVREKTLNTKSNDTHVTLVLYNTLDLRAEYEVEVAISLSQGKGIDVLHWVMIFAYATLAMVVVALALIIIAQLGWKNKNNDTIQDSVSDKLL